MTYEEAVRNEVKKRIYRIEFKDSDEDTFDVITSGIISGSLIILFTFNSI